MSVPAPARLAPVYFTAADDPAFAAQCDALRELLAGDAELLAPVALGDPVPAEADGALFAQMVGDGFRRAAEIRATGLPVLVLTSEFGTMAMWDWELIAYLREEGIDAIAPYSVQDARIACRALAARRALREGSFVVYQDAPGVGGHQPEIFKRFYWWEEECLQRMRERFGVRVIVRSFRELGARARALPDAVAAEERERIGATVPTGEDLRERAMLAALKLYRAIADDLAGEPGVLAAGLNCLNESGFSDTTPCLAWDLLYRRQQLVWGCEADTVSMLTKFILLRTLQRPTMMTNLYPFLMGQAALKHERIPSFPDVPEPENHILAAHCGYLGLLPQPMAVEWTLRGKVLAIVGDDSAVHDALLPTGDLTLAKLDPSFGRLVVIEGELEGYAGYPGSDCVNGGVIRVPDGHALMTGLPSHHSLIFTGHARAGLELIGRVFGLEVERLG